MAGKPNNWLFKQLQIIEKHLEKNEKWFQYPEKNMMTLEQDIGEWNTKFLSNMDNIEQFMQRIEKYMDD